MAKTKIFTDTDENALEREINAFKEKNVVENILFSTSSYLRNCCVETVFSVLIEYDPCYDPNQR